ncbi:hypothetical protein ACIRG5_24445 [Lentzea sp. NPDC102401]|uniref:hypothetical protein n=1 Tax=Lentzea sp. NPDC102401 TaxID=3364128 RepID=UPI0038169ED2
MVTPTVAEGVPWSWQPGPTVVALLPAVTWVVADPRAKRFGSDDVAAVQPGHSSATGRTATSRDQHRHGTPPT